MFNRPENYTYNDYGQKVRVKGAPDSSIRMSIIFPKLISELRQMSKEDATVQVNKMRLSAGNDSRDKQALIDAAFPSLLAQIQMRIEGIL